MMKKKNEALDEFVRNGGLTLRLANDDTDRDIVALIEPLDPSIQPSAQFRQEMRLRLLDLGSESNQSRRAA